MVEDNTSPFGTAFTVSIEARGRVTTGHLRGGPRGHRSTSRSTRRRNRRTCSRPGHIFPLRAAPGGVLERAGQTEASVDLARLAGLTPAGVICEIMNDDGTMARLPDLEKFAAAHGLKMISVADLIRYRLQHERLVAARSRRPTADRFRRVPRRRVQERRRRTKSTSRSSQGESGRRRADPGPRALASA